MARQDWVVGGDRRAAAAERIYTAAAELILRDGLDALDVDSLAEQVHCSRATIYRYAGGKAHIRDVVLLRIASGITDTVRAEVKGLTGSQRVVTAISSALKQIRSDAIRRLMMTSSKAPALSDLHSSPMLGALAAELTGITDDDPAAALWIVHVVLSMAYLPVGDEQIEAEILHRFIAPAFEAPAFELQPARASSANVAPGAGSVGRAPLTGRTRSR
ncbi:TetR/AcrR family transcriptional regulator [Mycobacterium hackensackense]|uniref:TetR/AcrR family transcriptional regulator n=1 Tax=Mycobacterium hackensackense TaxID=228909 RepID=UPI002265B554|nr:TetR/AcrR family transcriptional regulator [Mycobacterium hackensackense]MCV7254718.1 TetR/AcrR family transcriptional regulator [Mycobacterium hackensackense]